MSDRELLEMAARAVGMQVMPDAPWPAGMDGWFYAEHGPEGAGMYARRDGWWNPLTDDGDALRLAVKMGFISPGQWPNPGLVAASDWEKTGTIDWYSATRRAIVRAAAEIGRASAKDNKP